MKPDHSTDAVKILSHWGHVVDDHARSVLRRFSHAPPRLIEAVEYSLMAGGKRLRPALILECWRACHAGADGAMPSSSALAAAVAMELIHTFSLVHDDLPAMDDDDLRRGRPTNHKVFGEAMAILAGDAMVAMAFELLAVDAEAALVAPLVRELAQATGTEGMIGGQVLDVDDKNRPARLEELQHLHRMKTGALLSASCRMGAIAAKAPPAVVASLDRYGRHLGLAFQIVDDLLDQTSTPQQLGKATNKDAAKGKVTYPTLIGMDASRREAERARDGALEAVEGMGKAADGLRALARFVVERNV
ncbi:MAG TPA: farnesyl diphosphate synthase [Tepidisphaeraceae bacterium]|nr:farnesyl diphosphate synthase [Tepidisphaeraceae bacterium]